MAAGTIIDLQTLTSVFSRDPRLYNTLAYMICGSLLLGWMVVTLRSRSSLSRDYLAVAIIAPLTMLPVYHRPHDAILLILTIPACTMLLAEGGWLGGIALFLNSIAILITAAIPLGMLEILTKNWQVPAVGEPFSTIVTLFARPIPVILLALASFYMWVFVRRFSNKARAPDTGEQHV